MSLTRIAAGSLFAIIVGGFALHAGCASDDEPECSRDSACVSATTPCTKGVCREGKCVAEAVADGTKVADQSSVKDKLCVKLECKAGKATEGPDNSKTGEPVECNQTTCENMALKTTPLLNGVPCRSSTGTCQGGTCMLNPDTGPIGPKDTGPDADETSVDDAMADTEIADTEMDAATD